MSTTASASKALLTVAPYFTKDNYDAYHGIKFVNRDCVIRNPSGGVIFEQRDVEAPSFWSQTAVNVVASKYFYGDIGSPKRESSVKGLIHRVVRTIIDAGLRMGYYDKDTAETFYNELTHVLIHQMCAFNSPVWFNCGVYQQLGVAGDGKSSFYYDLDKDAVRRTTNGYERPQCSACFIQSVEDNMESLMTLARNEAMLFKYGSGSGSDLSSIRGAMEGLSGGGNASGPLSFLRMYDCIAGIIKSGGKTRRAAKMNTLKDWHPDIMEFITAKKRQEELAHLLIDAGVDGSFNGEAYRSVSLQNENLSVRLSDKFMAAVDNGDKWKTHWVTDPDKAGPTYDANEMLKTIAECTHFCGDPGVQFEDTINEWHTCKADGPINSSNPCSEYMSIDNSACNLASINLMEFRNHDGTFNTEAFQHTVRLLILAQDIIVDMASYPTKDIAKNSHMYRQLGLGYANLGAYLMSIGMPYDSVDGRSIAATITALMHMTAYDQSTTIAKVMGPFERMKDNRDSMTDVIMKHVAAVPTLLTEHPADPGLFKCVNDVTSNLTDNVVKHGVRNSQVTVLAPTGTISFLMDCDTTGVEPDVALVKYKLLASCQHGTEGGTMKLVNNTVGMALEYMGYSEHDVAIIEAYIEDNDTIEGAPGLLPEHLPVFDCAFKPANGTRCINYMAHLYMMAAVQPYLSGAISKTVNVPETATVEDIVDIYKKAWTMGIKAVAIYRDNSKRSQPLNTSKLKAEEEKTVVVKAAPVVLEHREKLPHTRRSVTHKFEIGNHDGYLTLGYYPDGRIGEMFVTMAKEGSTIRGLMDCWATAISIGLQYGVPMEVFKDKFQHTRFEPSGFCNGGSNIKSCTSLPDYIFRWVSDYVATEEAAKVVEPVPTYSAAISSANKSYSSDAPPCDRCGAITVRNGTCFKCNNCGNSLGCS